jgi:hypothetical protein
MSKALWVILAACGGTAPPPVVANRVTAPPVAPVTTCKLVGAIKSVKQHEPLAGVTLIAMTSGEPIEAISDAEGGFVLEGVTVGAKLTAYYVELTFEGNVPSGCHATAVDLDDSLEAGVYPLVMH